jgi:hypothetical protein
MTHNKDDNADADADNKPGWPTWAVGALFRGASHIYINRVVRFHITPPSLLRAGGTRKDARIQPACKLSGSWLKAVSGWPEHATARPSYDTVLAINNGLGRGC